jgi:hypothetical protein
METDHDYFERKHAELALIAQSLGGVDCPRPRSLQGVIETKFKLGAALRARHALQAWGSTQTNWNNAAEFRSGPFTFAYRYQRADLAITGPIPYGCTESAAGARVEGPVYTCSGMAAISALLLAVASGEASTLVHLPGCYKETLEFAAYAGLRTIPLQQDDRGNRAQPARAILWLDVPPFGQSAGDLTSFARAADLIVFDTTTFSAQSGRIPRFLTWARKARTPVILVRSHTKLDSLGIEYGRLGSATFLAFPEVPLAKLARWRKTASRTRDLVRLLGSAALPAHFCPFIGIPAYWPLSSRRTATILRNGHSLVCTLMQKLGGAAVRRYAHGMFAALVPPSCWSETEAAGEAEQLAAGLASGGLPIRHAGSFGFDFVATEGFFDTGANQHLLRVAMADLPSPICARVTDGISDWWARRWRTRAA